VFRELSPRQRHCSAMFPAQATSHVMVKMQSTSSVARTQVVRSGASVDEVGLTES
jgi:hypothetical protein